MYDFKPITTRYVRLNILEANEVPTIEQFQLFAPDAQQHKRTDLN